MALEEAADSAKRKFVEQAGKAMVKNAIDDLTLSPEQKAARDAENEKTNRMRLVKIILAVMAVVVGGVVLMKLMAQLWLYAIGFVVVAGLAGAGYLVGKPKLAALKQARLAAAAAREEERTRDEREQAAANKVKAEKQKLEDDLARLKQQL